MIPTVINLLMPGAMDIPANGWRNKKESILQKILEKLPTSKIMLLTYNREDMFSDYKNLDENMVHLQIKMNNIQFHPGNDMPLKDKIVELLSSKMVVVKNYAKKLSEEKKSETSISLDVYPKA